MNIHLLLSILKSYFLTAIVHESPPCSKIKGRTETKYFIVIHHKTVKVHNLEKKKTETDIETNLTRQQVMYNLTKQ